MMFKIASCEEDLFNGMQQAQEEALLAEETKHDQLVLAAMQALNDAAESFERSGRTIRAEEVTAVMVSLADSKQNEISTNKISSKKEAAKVFEFLGYKPEEIGFTKDF